MNRTRIFLALALSAFAFAGCKREAEAPPAAAAETAPAEEVKSAVISEVDHNSPASAAPGFDAKAFAGTYGGTLPCADCPGIRMRLTLMKDGRYEKLTQYLDRQPEPEIVTGTFSWESDGSTIRLDAAGDSQRFFVGENQVTMLYRDGTRPTGPLAGQYILRRAQ